MRPAKGKLRRPRPHKDEEHEVNEHDDSAFQNLPPQLGPRRLPRIEGCLVGVAPGRQENFPVPRKDVVHAPDEKSCNGHVHGDGHEKHLTLEAWGLSIDVSDVHVLLRELADEGRQHLWGAFEGHRGIAILAGRGGYVGCVG